MIERISITDNNGRFTLVELLATNNLRTILQRAHGFELPSLSDCRASWRAVTLGDLGAQNGTISIEGGTGNEQISRAYDITLFAQLGRGVETRLVVLKRWWVNSGMAVSGTGTLCQGVNIGLRAGEITWSLRNHNSQAESFPDRDDLANRR